MGFSIKKVGYSLLVPGLLIIISSIMVYWWPDLVRTVGDAGKANALLQLLPVLPYAVFSAGVIMGWRYSNTGMILGSAALALSYGCLAATGSGPGAVMGAGVLVMLPIDLFLLSLLTKRRLFTSLGMAALSVLVFQILSIWIFCEPGLTDLVNTTQQLSPELGKRFADIQTRLNLLFNNHSPLGMEHLSILGQVAFCWSFIVFIARLYFAPDQLGTGFFGALCAVFLGAVIGSPQAYMIFFFTAGLILLVTSIEASFSMAYMDELTGLPGRRSLNETMLNLGRKYVIAMIDIDHFKKFNDTYGHKTGDQVLKMIATRLGKMGGGAKTFRYGGEEFTAIFPGKEIFEALPHIEKYRLDIENTPFIIRSKGRKTSNASARGKEPAPTTKRVKVTVSIGVAEPTRALTKPEQVMKAADKILYKAKKSGRNCVKSSQD
ncbi:GGDEF domain-containing protein [Desulfatibacillum aliphaticivorans]|uniref:GGDEF domain-containing protein n=1 Tax=Desulfatibacillum aliphaticivorans TaxID=218208 RepID=UPI0006829EF1|nr:diguanylate cyclase [Desulfatibacillum aliphaticivorans]